ncbi:hypothetical protein [Erythrobacter sp. EC-HK427]|uniref:hypothetical protein n=1 Tax=Erythrobacter sp. EC-HK427 TaxID=2038396 RepID=UPI0012519E61|nr:hypothetical protein [Erythrobacter sp. EC-HK427]VVT19720.1 conserved hypothetical protein [Erythrobacter sp. EC-HK427]
MELTFLVIAAMGVMLLALLPRSEIRWQRIGSRGGAAMLIGLGLFGAVHSALAQSV